MTKITVVSPYNEFAKLFVEVFEKHNQRSDKPEYEYEEYELEVMHLPGFIEVEKAAFNSDVIIVRGAIAYHLRKRENFIPFVEVLTAGFDLIQALSACKKEFGCKPVAVIGTTNITMGVEHLSPAMGMEIVPFAMNNEHNLEAIVEKVAARGFNTLVGGAKTCKYAKKLGLNTMLIKSGFESIWQAITEAKRVAYISRREQAKAQQYKTIIDYAYEGIIAVDNQNKISVLNSAAKNVLGINGKNIIGHTVDEIIPNQRLRKLISENTKYLNELVNYKDIQLNINKIPITYKDKNAGNVLTFQDVTRIQEMEGKIRQKIYARGHIAKHTFEDIIGKSNKTMESIRIAKKFSKVDSNILIYGETGTGKELFAQSIHNYSERREGPFVAVNCAALPESLLESELFGYAEGAFTGAAKGGKPGLFELAHGGTIFLDEISEISPPLQGRLLRVLQEREIMRLGHDRVIPINVRVLSATNKDLETLVRKGEFREDLFYRLDVLKINLPTLNERIEDIPEIVETFIRRYQMKYGKEEIIVDTDVINALKKCDWPGNIRQLENICERLVVLNDNNVIRLGDIVNILPKDTVDEFPKEHENSKPSYLSYIDELKEIEKKRIHDALENAGYNKSKAARMLGINRTMLWRRMIELKIEDHGAKRAVKLK